MIFSSPIELLKAAEKLNLIKINFNDTPDENIPVLYVFKPNEFRTFLIDVASKTDCMNEKEFCLSNLVSFEETWVKKKERNGITEEDIDTLKDILEEYDTVDDILKAIE